MVLRCFALVLPLIKGIFGPSRLAHSHKLYNLYLRELQSPFWHVNVCSSCHDLLGRLTSERVCTPGSAVRWRWNPTGVASLMKSTASPLRHCLTRLPMAKHHNTFATSCPTTCARLPCRHTVTLLLKKPVTASPLESFKPALSCRVGSWIRPDRKRRRGSVLQRGQQENYAPVNSDAGLEVPATTSLFRSAPKASQLGQLLVLQVLHPRRQPFGDMGNLLPASGRFVLLCSSLLSACFLQQSLSRWL